MTSWRIGRSGPLRCIVLRKRDGSIDVQASILSRKTQTVPATDVFSDREACRVEFARRRSSVTSQGNNQNG